VSNPAAAASPVASLWAAGAIFLCAEAGGYLMPLLLESVSRTYGIGEAAAGGVMALQLAAFAVAAVGLSPWVASFSPRRGALLALGLVIAGNLLSTIQPHPALLVGGRLLTGFGEGFAAAVATASIARTHDPDRAFARVFTAVVLMTLLIFLVLPTLMAGQDARRLFAAIACLPLLALPAVAWLPDQPSGAAPARFTAAGGSLTTAALLLCAALMLYSVAANAYWVYVERIATHIGMTPAAYGQAFAIGTVAALAGPVAAERLGTRFGRLPPLVISCVLVGGGGWLTTHAATPFLMVCGLSISSAAFLFGTPYFLGLAAQVDRSGRIAAAGRGFNAVGSALAPALAGGVLGLTGAYSSIGWTSLAAAALALGLVLLCFRRSAASAD
jgi:predicted MFS family arabinose efflux permease